MKGWEKMDLNRKRNRVYSIKIGSMKSSIHLLTALRSLFRDARNFQIVFLSSFLLYGIWYLDWDHDIVRFAIIISTALMVQLVGVMLSPAPMHSLKSALITGLGMSLLFQANSYITLVMGVGLAIAGKFLIRSNGKHIFNPANFGIVVTILLTGDAWISPGQWGSSALLVFFIGAAGLMVILKAGRVDTSFAFLATLFLLEYVRTIVYLGWDFDFLLLKFSNGSLLLFSFFMITDPVTTPNHLVARIVWASLIAVVTFSLSNFMQVHTAPLWALFFISPLTVGFDRLLKSEKFQWIKA